MLKLTIPIAGDAIVEISGNDNKERIEQASFWMTLPKVCPECNAPLILSYRRPQNYPYYGLICTGDVPHECNFGIRRDDTSLFYNPHRKPWKVAQAKYETPDEAQIENGNESIPDNVTPIRQNQPKKTPDSLSSADRKNVTVRINGFCSKIRSNGGTIHMPSHIPKKQAWSAYTDQDLLDIEKSLSEQLDFLQGKQRTVTN